MDFFFGLDLDGRWPVRIPQRRRQTVREGVDYGAGVVVLRVRHQRSYPQNEQHQRLNRQRRPHHSTQETTASSQRIQVLVI